MKIFPILLLIQAFLFFYQQNAESKNIKFNIDGKLHTILYVKKKVSFSDLDLLSVMYHSNHVKHCGNSIIQYLLKLSSNDIFHMNFVVRHIEITYKNVLKYNNKYKIIGAITDYGNTSMKISLYGVGSSSDEMNKNSSFTNLLLNNSESDANEEQNIHKILDNYDEDDDSSSINLSNQEISKLKEKNCVVYFSVNYVLVKVDKNGLKRPIKSKFKEENLPMEVEQVEDLAKALC
ncbi:conserved Plasmodium protein, unknown function [Plasmodium relictum]|uniref:Fam-a protein n=1 Tax=Plasmodium relictum TaxID=85471 RepID=A0A1J1H643_PLARL|nr:conserved Plasmodium protein, unknown function [Plasmodium relictum]CRH00227.1 conserved Plasmodium protein, unknown function [Plasmodium relictum]